MNTAINSTNTFYIFSQNKENTPLISYKGAVTSSYISILFEQAEKSLNLLNCPIGTKKKIVGIMIELLQNILHHSPIKTLKNKKKAHSFLLQKNEGKFVLTASNLISGSKIEFLKKRIKDLNSYTSEKLESLYRDILRNGTQKGENAGLGLIDIIRKSCNPIFFKFVPAGNKRYLFTVKVIV